MSRRQPRQCDTAGSKNMSYKADTGAHLRGPANSHLYTGLLVGPHKADSRPVDRSRIGCRWDVFMLFGFVSWARIITIGSKSLEYGYGMICDGCPSFRGFGIRGRSCCNLLAPTVFIGSLSYLLLESRCSGRSRRCALWPFPIHRVATTRTPPSIPVRGQSANMARTRHSICGELLMWFGTKCSLFKYLDPLGTKGFRNASPAYTKQRPEGVPTASPNPQRPSNYPNLGLYPNP